MKLWKSKKSAASSCVSAVSGKLNLSGSKHDYKDDDQAETISAAAVSSSANSTNQSSIHLANGNLHQVAQGRAMSPAQSEDSGLAADRGSTYVTISIARKNCQSMGITLADRTDFTYPPTIESISNLSEPNADFLAPGDRVHQVDGISTIGLTNEQVMNLLLHNRDENAVIEIEYSLPDYLSQNSLCVTTKLAQVIIERENGCLGLTLRGGSEMPIIVTSVRPFGPAYKTSRIKPGDRVLRVDNISLNNKSLAEAQQILKCGHNSPFCTLTIEYEVSVMQTVEFSLGPLLIEIERSMHEQMGLMLSSFMPLAMDFSSAPQLPGIFISNIIPASIADRCGALSVGDQILSVDETIVENTSFTAEDVLQLIDSNCTKGFIQLQIIPASAAIRRRGLSCTSPKFNGFNTMDPRRTPKLSQSKKFYRKSSLPLDNNALLNNAMTRTERIQVILDCTYGSGLSLSMTPQTGSGFVVTKIQQDSVAEHCGSLQVGDRIVSVNKLYNLDIHLIRQILRDTPTLFHHQQQKSAPGTVYWVELEVEFEMIVDDSSYGIFNVKLMKANRNSGLGITVNGSAHGAMVVTDIKAGSPAHRSSVKVGDVVLAIDNHPIQHYNVDIMLKENKNDCITLTLRRNCVPDFAHEAQNRGNVVYANFDAATNTFGGYMNDNNLRTTESQMRLQNSQNNYEEPHYSVVPAPRYWNTMKPARSEQQDDILGNSLSAHDLVNYNNVDLNMAQQKLMSLSIGPMQNVSHGTQTEFNQNNNPALSQNMFNVLLKPNGGPLGITLAGNDDGQKAIVISGIVEGGIAHQTGQLRIGDVLLAINNESVVGLPLSKATRLLQTQNETIDLKLSRPTIANATATLTAAEKAAKPQPLYAEVQRRNNNLMKTEVDSSSSSRSGSSDGQLQTIHVALYKDQVYDDYGFSVSDGLYERGVYINRIRSGGPADKTCLLKPYDRIIQVNGTKTLDYDCCLTVPLIAASGDRINLIVQRGILE